MARFEVFVYGSNLFSAKLREAAPSASKRYAARLPEHVLRFQKHSRNDGSGKADAHFTGDRADVVWGAVYSVAESDREALATSEGGYDRKTVSVVDWDGKAIETITYVANPTRVQANLLPYDWYRAYVIAGALEHGLPPGYVEFIRSFDVTRDADDDRRQKNWRRLAANYEPLPRRLLP